MAGIESGASGAGEQTPDRRIEDLSAADPMVALRRATEWLRETAESAALDPAGREAQIRRIDDAAQPKARLLAREFLTMAPLPEKDELALWRANREFWAQLGASYYACFNEAERGPAPTDALRRIELARLTARMMRAYAARLKWDQFRYWPPSVAVWQIAGRAWLYAQQNGYDRREISAYHGEHPPTTVELEYLRTLAFQVSAADALLPFEIEIAERLIAAFLPLFSIEDTRSAASTHWVDPAGRRAPSRMSEAPPESATVRYLTTLPACDALGRLREALAQGSVPPHLDLAHYPSPRILAPVVEHLMLHWAASPPERAHDRHRVQAEAGAVTGIAAITRVLARPDDARGVVRWVVEDVSQGGLRVRLPLAEAQSLPIGTVVGMRPAGGDNWLAGIVRRFARVSAEAGAAGIETISRHPLAVEIGTPGSLQCALLLDAPDAGERVRLVMPSPAFDPGQAFDCMLAGAPLRLRAIETLEALGSNADTMLMSCEVEARPAAAQDGMKC
ncbi:MAG: hypothetical protein Fur0039_09670 [Rhodocyclaceae bacterium]